MISSPQFSRTQTIAVNEIEVENINNFELSFFIHTKSLIKATKIKSNQQSLIEKS
jgi:hypothetical protein